MYKRKGLIGAVQRNAQRRNRNTFTIIFEGLLKNKNFTDKNEHILCHVNICLKICPALPHPTHTFAQNHTLNDRENRKLRKKKLQNKIKTQV